MNLKTVSYGILLAATAAISHADEAYQWTGAYAGANLGAIWSGADLKARHMNFVSPDGTYDQSFTATAVNPGLQFGYLHQLDPAWVIGGEADFTYPDAESHYSALNAAGTAIDRFRVRNDLQGSLRLRVGYAMDRFLSYVTAGVSFGSLQMTYDNEPNNHYAKSTTQTGWVLGAGLEYGIFDNLSTRLEYLYTDYGSALNMNMPIVSGVADSQGAAHADVYSNVLRAGVNFRF